MNQQSNGQPDVAGWAEESREFTREMLAVIGEREDLMQTNPGRAVRIVGEELAEWATYPELSEDEWARAHMLLMLFAGEFLISAYEARWDWLVDASSPLGGRWVVTGFTHPLGQETAPVDVGWLAHEARVDGTFSLAQVINRALALSMIRVFR
ncbi:hypothetical protein ACFVTF_00885 [Kitasatospora sp. NPDC057940]|uniref:hypothetical protein n=1 Tax=Kitasatospora sp. NPDC057940 TaxID=3346285 RepID=UPI0036DB3920